MSKFIDVSQRGTNAARPAANAVPTGALYFDTTNSQMTRSNGSTWDIVEGTGGMSNPMTTAGDIITGGSSGTPQRLAKGSDSTVLTIDPSTHVPVWAAATGGMTNPMTTQDDIIVGGASGTPARLAKGTDSQVLTVDPSTHHLVWATPSGGGAPTTTPYVTTASDAGLSAKVAIPGLAGSADIKGAAGGGTSEEFDGSDPFTYAPSVPDGAHNVNSTILSHLYAKITDGTVRTATKAWSPAGAFDARARVIVGADNTAQASAMGIYVADTSDSNFMTVHVENNPGGSNVIAQGYVYNGTFFQQGSNVTVNHNDLYVRITRNGSNQVSTYYSTNGILWIPFAINASFTFTVAKIGFRFYTGGAATCYYAADWLRTDV